MSDSPAAAILQSDRSSSGQFAAGNRGGPGNPFARRVAELRRLILEALDEAVLRDVINAMTERARNGDIAATRLLLQYGYGKPAQAVEPEKEDAVPQSTKAVEPAATNRPTNAAPATKPSKSARKAMYRELRRLGREEAPSPNPAMGVLRLDDERVPSSPSQAATFSRR